MDTRRQFMGRTGSLLLGTLLPAATRNALAQEKFPSRPVKLLVGFPAGGPMDVSARLVIDSVGESLGAVTVVENKPGASGIIATQQVALARPDGSTLAFAATANIVTCRFLYSKLGYDPDRDLVPIGQFASSRNVVYASKASGVTSFRQWLEAVREHPDRYSYASPGNGTTPHLTMEMLKAGEKLSVAHIPFRGSAAAINAVVGGELPFGIDALGPTIAMAKAGKVLPLVQAGTRRSAIFPDTPTLSELGYEDFPVGSFLGLMAPAQTPAPILAQLERGLREAAGDADLRRRLQDMGVEAAFLTGDDFKAAIQRELPFWRRAVDYAGVKPA